jgi:hypothetical protein
MKLNNTFLAVKWEKDSFMKSFYREKHMSNETMMSDAAMANAGSFEKMAWRLGREEIVDEMCRSKGVKIFYLTHTAQDAASHIKYAIANMKWLRQIKDQRSIYVTGKDEFYRFTKEDDRIMVLQYSRAETGTLGEWIGYEGFALDLKEEELKMLPTQDQDIAHRFIKLLMFIEMTKTEVVKVAPQQKVVYGKGGDDKLFNDTGLNNVFLVNATWNKIIVVQGDFKVRGHFRVQPCGVGRKDYKLIWIEEFMKGSFVRRAGKEISNESNPIT